MQVSHIHDLFNTLPKISQRERDKEILDGDDIGVWFQLWLPSWLRAHRPAALRHLHQLHVIDKISVLISFHHQAIYVNNKFLEHQCPLNTAFISRCIPKVCHTGRVTHAISIWTLCACWMANIFPNFGLTRWTLKLDKNSSTLCSCLRWVHLIGEPNIWEGKTPDPLLHLHLAKPNSKEAQGQPACLRVTGKS